MTPPNRLQAQQKDKEDERRKLADPDKLAKLGITKWDRSPVYVDPIESIDPLHGRTLMHLSDAMCEQFMIAETDRIGGADRTAKIVRQQNATYTHSPYDIGGHGYGDGYKHAAKPWSAVNV